MLVSVMNNDTDDKCHQIYLLLILIVFLIYCLEYEAKFGCVIINK